MTLRALSGGKYRPMLRLAKAEITEALRRNRLCGWVESLL